MRLTKYLHFKRKSCKGVEDCPLEMSLPEVCLPITEPPPPASRLGENPRDIQISLTPAWPAEGQTETTIVAIEPEIIDFIYMLKEMNTTQILEQTRSKNMIVTNGGCCCF